MKIAILSDIHDHIENLQQALDQIDGTVEAIIYCGDFAAAFTPIVLGRANVPIYACLGNVDEDQIGMVQFGGENFDWTPLLEEFGEVELGERNIAYCHYPKLGELLAKSGDYDAVFHGHTHKTKNKKIGKTLLLNPGAVCGINPRHIIDKDKAEPGIATYAIYDTENNSAKIIEIWSGMTDKQEKEKQEAKEKAIRLAIGDGYALSRRGLNVYGINAKGKEKLISKSKEYKDLWQDALKELQK